MIFEELLQNQRRFTSYIPGKNYIKILLSSFIAVIVLSLLAVFYLTNDFGYETYNDLNPYTLEAIYEINDFGDIPEIKIEKPKKIQSAIVKTEIQVETVETVTSEGKGEEIENTNDSKDSLTKINQKMHPDSIFIKVDEMPRYLGGEDQLRAFILKNIIYPESALKDNPKGVVYVRFIINESGKITNPVIIKGIHKLIDNEVLRLIKRLPQWEPGRNKGKNVKVAFILPIVFL